MTTRAEHSTPWRLNFLLFLATLGSVFFTSIVSYVDVPEARDVGFLRGLWLSVTHQTRTSLCDGAQFAGALLTILVAHELGHYIAARIHKVETSLPFFIPMPIVSPFGTMGAVIRMRGTIPTRRALFDIGAAGPLAGLVFALPIYAWGIAHSRVVSVSGGGIELGESVLIRGLDYLFGPHTPDGMTAMYSPAAFGAWGGMFVTMINLLPVAQLDGGHVAYALFGEKQDRYAVSIHRAMLAFFGVIIVGHFGRDLTAGREITATGFSRHLGNAVFWLVWFQVVAVLGTLSTRRAETETDDARRLPIATRLIAAFGLIVLASCGRAYNSWLLVASFFIGLGLLLAMEVTSGVLRPHDLLTHPRTSAEPLGPVRRSLAIGTLVLFGLLFMPEPFGL